ncbi:MAG: NUDIX hydrolase [Agriterribacter sp.]
MVLKIYFSNKPVFLCDEITPAIEEYRHHPDTVFIDELTNPAVKSLLHEIAKPGFHAGILYHPDINQLKKMFWKHFTVIQAGGGLVRNKKGAVLMIYRRGKWDLPKGKLDKGETLEECALREVQEETGLQQVKLGSFLLTTYHVYEDFGKHILKESYWYTMQANGSETTKPQVEEDIHEIQWVQPPDVKEKLKNTFPSIVDVMKAATLA